MRDASDDLTLAHQFADVADALCKQAFGGANPTEAKADGSPVSAIDREIEDRIRAMAAIHRPSDLFLGEERSDDPRMPAPDAIWIVDPIDHTRHFVRGDPNYATLIALRVNACVEVAVVSAPSLGLRWSAARGRGAYLNGAALSTSPVTELREAHIAIAGHREWIEYYEWPAIKTLMDGAAYICGTPGGFYPAMQVACGQLDAFIEPWGAVWDHAALGLIVTEAGGHASTLGGDAPAGGSLLATNGNLHPKLLDAFKNAAKHGSAP